MRENGLNKKILDFIPRGKKNAISVKRLAEISGARSESNLRGDIAELRKAGELICSSPAGYYRPATRAELDDFIKRMKAHAIGVFQAIASAQKAQKEMEGQQSLDL